MVVSDDVNKSGDDANKHDDIGSSFELNMYFGDTLYLHPNDTGGSPIVTIKLTGTENYNMWSIVMNFALRNHNKLGFIDGSCKRDNNMILLINGICFLMGLDESYLAIRSNILTREPLPLVKAAYVIVSGEESHRNATYVGTTKPIATTFAAKTFDNKMRFNNNNNFNKGSSSNSNSNNICPNPNLKCTNYNKIGHTVDRSFELVGYLDGYVKKNFNANTKYVSSNNVSADLARLLSLLNDNGVSTGNANMAGLIIGTLDAATICADSESISSSKEILYIQTGSSYLKLLEKL
ncbi:ribonuclease H-like domain-containing protein [Tanacetum coccineum]